MIDDPELPKIGVAAIDAISARWCVWAPKASKVELVLGRSGSTRSVAMDPIGRGYFACVTEVPKNGQRYAYRLDGGFPLPDPWSMWQPEGVGKPSAVVFAEQFSWNENGWRGIEREKLVFYELHVGTFSSEGTFDAIIPRIEALRDLGINAIELMPIGEFPGRWSWGYDGVHPFAPHHGYGGPEGLKHLVEACHQRGMAVYLDVVYNHFGPEGNVFPRFGDYVTDKYRTDWGEALNFDGRGCDSVRAMVLENARQWIGDYHFDGLRLDAADQIYDRSPRHILSEVAEVVHREAARLGRRAYVFTETDLNDAPRFLRDRDRGGYGIDGHWNDDFHHAAHVTLTGETNGYYADFAAGPRALAKAYERVFVNDGTYSPFRGRRHGAPAMEFDGDRFVAFTQNHDQVGNRLKSDRYAAMLPPSATRLAAGILLLAPRLPLLFMGEEYGETNPFPYFCDYRDTDLVNAVRRGRKAEFAYFGWENEIPDPVSASTRESAVLSWSWGDAFRAGMRRLYGDLLRLRRELGPLRDYSHAKTQLLGDPEDPTLLVVKRGGHGPDTDDFATIVLNLSGESQQIPAPFGEGVLVLRSEREDYGGPIAPHEEWTGLVRPHEFVIIERRP